MLSEHLQVENIHIASFSPKPRNPPRSNSHYTSKRLELKDAPLTANECERHCVCVCCADP